MRVLRDGVVVYATKDSSVSSLKSEESPLKPEKGALKVLTQRDSLALCKEKQQQQQHPSRRLSLTKTVTWRRSSTASPQSTASSSSKEFSETKEEEEEQGEEESHKVRFRDVQSRQYHMAWDWDPNEQSNHPTTAPSIGLDWTYVEEEPVPVDRHETEHPQRRRESELRLSVLELQERLGELGASEEVVDHACYRILESRKERRERTTKPKKTDEMVPEEPTTGQEKFLNVFRCFKAAFRHPVGKAVHDGKEEEIPADNNADMTEEFKC